MKKLDFTAVSLHGRSAELEILRDSYKGAANGVHVVLVYGHSGTGKSALVREISQELSDEGYFVSGKFSQLRTTEPYSALTETFNELCDLILAAKDTDPTIAAFTEDVGSKGRVLLNVIPKLNQLLAEVDQDVRSTLAATRRERRDTAFHQLKFVFLTFVRSVCAVQKNPVVLFLDDLQWADVPSLELIMAMISDSKLQNLLFIGSYRDNEVDKDHPLTTYLDRIEHENKNVKRVPVENLDTETVNSLICNVTELRSSLTQPLTEIVHRKTNGNPFFVKQFLLTLQETGLLYFSSTTCRWEWDGDGINSNTYLTRNVGDLVAGKIKRLDTKVQEVLKLAAALWSTFDSELLREVMVKAIEKTDQTEELKWEFIVNDKDDLVELLDIAAEEGLLDRLDASRFKFAHDRIQQAAYSLIPEGSERHHLHQRIGTLLWNFTKSSRCQEWMYFAAADQMNRGANVLSNEPERVDLAQLNLQAAEKAISLSAFVPALSYLRFALGYLPSDTRWCNHYKLCLKLQEMLAEMEHCVGDAPRTKIVIDEVLTNARSFQDKMNVYKTLCASYLAQGKRQETIELGYYLLQKFDESVPRRGEKIALNLWSIRLKRMLQSMSDDDLFALPDMNDERKMAAMEICQLIHSCTTLQEMITASKLVTIKMMFLSLQYGASEFSPHAYANWGECLICEGNIEEGYRFGKLAVKLAKRVGSDHVQARVTSFACIFLNHWREPLQQSLDPILNSHNNGMIIGDITYAFLAILGYQGNYFYSGLPLPPAAEDLIAFSKQMEEYKQHMVRRVQLPLLQCILNLMGRSDNILQLTGEVMDQAEFESSETNPHQLGVQAIVSCRMQLAYYFQEIDLAGQLKKKLERISKDAEFEANYLVCVRTTFFGLISIALARKTKRRKHAASAAKIIADMEKKWVKRGAVNCLHKLLLLKAEYSTLKHTPPEQVKDAFDRAISTARRIGFLQDEALANERAGVFFLENDDKLLASSYLSRGRELYNEWGAQAKVDHLDKLYGAFLEQNEEEKYAANLRGRSRFSNEPYKSHKTLSAGQLVA